MAEEPKSTASPLYALGRLEQALTAAASHADPLVRKRAAARVEQWRAVLAGISAGKLTIGARTPVADTPAWVTLEVAHGGFATGRFLAEGELAAHEVELAGLIDGDAGARERINAWYLGDEGQAALVAAIREGRLTVELPEDGALPVVAWLLAAGQGAEGLDLIATLRPLMHRLRFYPRLEATPRPAGAVVRVATNAQVAEGLRGAPPRPQIAAMNEALRVWNPLYDRLVALWLETVDGEAPRFVGETELRTLAGGWPGRVWPAEWTARRGAWLGDYLAAAKLHPRCRKHTSPDSNFFRLRVVLEKVAGGRAMLPEDECRVRHALAGTLTRRGAPGSPERTRLRAEQAEVAARPSNVELAEVLARRVDRYPAKGGLPGLELVAAPIGEGEYAGVRAGTEIPAHMIFKASRALEAPVAELVERGIIGSAEVLAAVLPQITAQVAAAGISDPGLRDLYSQVYAAFRRRRSLLLLNLEDQVRFDDLPWVAALAPLRRDSHGTAQQARQTLEEVAILAFTGFPETILPNPLVREMSALAPRAELKIPFVEEVAADIFMGTFTVKWAEAATIASRLLAGTVYAHYYDLPAADDAGGPDKRGWLPKLRWGKPTDEAFVKLCNERAREAGTNGGSWVAKNGAIIEQSMILTSHNLAALVSELGLAERVRVLAPTLAGRALKFAVRRQAQCPPDFKSQLQAVKNAAYAWRQGIFFLSFCAPEVQWRVVDETAVEIARAANKGWAERFMPALFGLRHVLGGGRFAADGHGPGPELAVRFLGWSVGKHWVFA